MGKLQLVIASASQIQSYIFASNRLREHVGASHLVAQATGAWALQAAAEVVGAHNVGAHNLRDAGRLMLDAQFKIEDHHTEDAAEVIYSGGGNVEVLFTRAESAKNFVRALSRKLLLEAPGLRVAFGQAEFEWEQTTLAEASMSARADQDKGKRALAGSGAGLPGLGVTAACTATGLPAVARDEGKPISAESMARLAAFDAADKGLRATFQQELRGFRFPYDLDKLGRSRGDDSHIAVLHADGNGIGALKAKMMDGIVGNREYIRRSRDFSSAVREISHAALAATLDTLSKRVMRDERTGAARISHEVEGRTIRIDLPSAGGGQSFLPVRPIIYGGDDLTIVCDGRIALSFAELYLHQFELTSAVTLGKYQIKQPRNLSACAGVAIVRSHFPFARAYELSEELAGEAKKRRAAVQQQMKSGDKPDEQSDYEPGSFLDWHIAMSGLIGDLDEIRSREYEVRGATEKHRLSMTLRPVAVSVQSGVRTWDAVRAGIDEFQTNWADHRNKVKALREALRGGPTAVERFVRVYQGGAGDKRPVLPKLSGAGASVTTSGFADDRCAYYDAIELMDMYVPIDLVASNAEQAEKSEVKK